jgi:NADH dehydrogenase (ubiquinone) 1 beta subcomplex subunit 7
MGGDHHFSPAAMPKADQDLESLKANQIALGYRDNCAHLLVGLNSCRRQKLFNPHKCTHERHTYEECEYIAWKARSEKKTVLVAAQKIADAAAAAAAADN